MPTFYPFHGRSRQSRQSGQSSELCQDGAPCHALQRCVGPRGSTGSMPCVAGFGSGWDGALRFLAGLRLSRLASCTCSAYTKSIGACQQSWQHAVLLLHSAVACLQHNIVTFTSSIQACKACSKWEVSVELFAQISQQSLKADTIALSAATSALLKVHSKSKRAANLESGQWQAVVRSITRLEAVGLRADAQSCSLGISACAEAARWRGAFVLLQILREALQADSVACNAAICSCQNAANWKQALSVLRDMAMFGPRPASVSLCSAVSAFMTASVRQWERALVLEMLFRCGGLDPTEATSNAVASALKWQCAFQKLAMQSRSCRDTITTITVNVTSGACAKADKWQEALHVSQSMSAIRMKLDVTTLVTCQTVLLQTRLWQQALSSFREFDNYSLRRNEVSYKLAIRACELGGWQASIAHQGLQGLQGPKFTSFAAMGREGHTWQAVLSFLHASSIRSFGAAISTGAKHSQWRLAFELVREAAVFALVPNAIIVNSAIGACEGTVQWRAALALFTNMDVCRLRQDEATYVAINACEYIGQWKQALLILNQFNMSTTDATITAHNTAISSLIASEGNGWCRAVSLMWVTGYKGLKVNAVTFNACAAVCQRTARWRVAFFLLESQMQRSLLASLLAISASMSACEQAREWQRAWCMLHQLDSGDMWPLSPDVIAFNVAISTCEKASEWEQALKLLGLLASRSIEATVSTYNAAISACGKAEKSQSALELLHELQARVMLPDAITYNAAASALGRASRWHRALLLFAATTSPTAVSYGAAISACATASKWEPVLLLLKESAMRSLATTTAFSAALCACIRAKQWQWALRLAGDVGGLRVASDIITCISTINACEAGHRQQAAVSFLCKLSSMAYDPLRLWALPDGGEEKSSHTAASLQQPLHHPGQLFRGHASSTCGPCHWGLRPEHRLFCEGVGHCIISS